MEPILLRASEESKNQRLDAFLASSLDGLTRSQATRLIESGEVAVDGKSVSKSYKLARTYECIVVGALREDRGTVDAPIARHPTDRKRMAVVAGGREAVTHWEVIARYPGYTHVRCRLETGRTHQIRVHMAYIGHPILGDTVYGAKKEVAGLTGQCLHAVGLRFLHPRTHEVVELSCPLPDEFTRMLQKIRK